MSYISHIKYIKFKDDLLLAIGLDVDAVTDLIKLKQGLVIDDLGFLNKFFKSIGKLYLDDIKWTNLFLLWLHEEAFKVVKKYVPEAYNKEFLKSLFYVQEKHIEMANSKAFDKLNLGLCPSYERSVIIKYALMCGLDHDKINELFHVSDYEWKEFNLFKGE